MSFIDAVHRFDTAQFVTLWADGGEWQLDPPMDLAVSGKSKIVGMLENLMSNWQFFNQSPHIAKISVDGEHATGRVYMHETGLAKDGSGLHIWGIYHDTYVKVSGEWKFAKRHFEFRLVESVAFDPQFIAAT